MTTTKLICRTLVLKVASRCNLNCTYCYVYNQGDRTYRNQPVVMTEAIQTAVIGRVREHCLEHGLTTFQFIFHGGEPLLAGPDFYRSFVRQATGQLMRDGIRPYFFMQTNGTLLSEAWCQLLNDLHISVGISIDSDPETHDTHRVDHAGRGSYAVVARQTRLAMQLLRYRPGLLTVIDPTADPVRAYHHWKSLNARTVGLQLPYATHDQPPPKASATAYADWLIALFDVWFDDESPTKPAIGLLRQLIELIIGIDRGWEHLGQLGPDCFVIETDGGIEPNGSLKLCGNGFTKVGLNVLHTALSDVGRSELFRRFVGSHRQLPAACRRCPVVTVCGGGLLAHRYQRDSGFANPSVYCQDLYKLILHMNERLIRILPNQPLRTLTSHA